MKAQPRRAGAAGSGAAAAAKKTDAESAAWLVDDEGDAGGRGLPSTQPLPSERLEMQRYILRLVQYFVMTLLCMLVFSYSFERRLRVELVNQFTLKLERASEAIFAEKQKSQLEEEAEDGGGGDGGQPCGAASGGGNSAQSPLLSAVTSALIDSSSKLTLQDVLDSWRTRHGVLVEALTLMSRELLRVKYGAPPYYAKFDLSFPPSSTNTDASTNSHYFLLQLDGEAMPYTSLYFLEQVSAGAWDTCQFIVNAGVLLQVDTRGESCSRAAFKQIKSVGESLAFQEYAPKLATGEAHKRLTVGLSGRPAGPIFYVSLVNNQAVLGPKTDPDSDFGAFGLPPQADPCFAKVVRGEETIERINRQPVRDGDTQIRMLQEFVTITKASVLPSADALALIGNCDPSTTLC